MKNKYLNAFIETLWNSWCLLSIVGIWPRWIEPNLLCIKRLTVPIKNLTSSLCGLRIVQFSDLHLNQKSSAKFLRRLSKKINSLQADIIVFTGDFLCRSKLVRADLLVDFLNSLQAKHGHFAILGNHDYAFPISRAEDGTYIIVEEDENILLKGFKLLFKPKKNTRPSKIPLIPLHDELLELLKKTPFKLLHNKTVTLHIRKAPLAICGLGEYIAGQCLPYQAYVPSVHPLIVLLHNPDAIDLLKDIPADLVLSGHTHGAQVNLPFIWKRLCDLEKPQFKRGMHTVEGKQLYVNRGVGGLPVFRWFSVPEITLFKLEKEA